MFMQDSSAGEAGSRTIGVLTFPIAQAGTIPLSHLMEITCSLSGGRPSLITGNDGYTAFSSDERFRTFGISHEEAKSPIARAIRFLATQVKISHKVVQIRDVDVWIFFIGGDLLLLPMLTARILRKKVLLMFAGSAIEKSRSSGGRFGHTIRALTCLTSTLATGVVLYAHGLVEEYHLEPFEAKVHIAHEHYIDFGRFHLEKSMDGREPLIAFIGRFSEEKGVRNFVQAVPSILEALPEARILIGGNGPLEGELQQQIAAMNLQDRVQMEGWIPHERLPEYLNRIRLITLPSYTEGLPNLMLEAMACGTPVVAHAVGVIPEIVQDGRTGFIMNDNSPACIARNVIRAFRHPDLETIAAQGMHHVEKEFGFEAAVQKCSMALKRMCG